MINQQRDTTLYTRIPFVGLNQPFIGDNKTSIRPFIRENRPFIRDQGFTLVELMITLAILAVIGSFALPSFRDTILNMRIRTEASELVGAFQIARSESIKRKAFVAVCAKNAASSTCNTAATTSWDDGWLIWIDTNRDAVFDGGEELVRQSDGMSSGVIINTSASLPNLSYLPDGSSNVAVGTEFRVCDNNRTGELGRRVELTLTGRAKVSEYTCP
ncbi:MAG: GspH/FimT family pseudopilin [Gammaproteobacteria bacterium]|nr:GspH/FimT family pseudopilin [Gammaproteobacteria bacterium]